MVVLGIIMYVLGVMPCFVILREFVASRILRIVLSVVFIGAMNGAARTPLAIVSTLIEIVVAVWGAILGWQHYPPIFAIVLTVYAMLMIIWFIGTCVKVLKKK